MSQPSAESDPVEPTPSGRRRPETRIGDRDRDQAVAHLREHLAAGRLDAVEFEERMGKALEARTASELTPLFGDLPEPKPSLGSSALSPQFQAPPWQRQSAPTPAPIRSESREVATPPRPTNTALAVAASVAWPITILAITFALGWSHYWWLVFVPIVLSSMVGKDRQDRHRHGHNH